MTKQYEQACENARNQLHNLVNSRSVQEALNKKLPNDSEATDEDDWVKASISFWKANDTKTKEWLK